MAVRRWRLALLVSTLLLWPAYARAAVVAVVRPAGASAAVNEAFSRLQGELLSVGFEVVVAERPAGLRQIAPGWVLQVATARGADAVLDIVGDATPVGVDVWILMKPPGSSEISRVTVERSGEDASGRLAIRAVEVLRSSFLESDLTARRRIDETTAMQPAVEVARAEPPDTTPHDHRLGFELGGALLTGVDGVGPALLPIARVDWAARPWLLVQAAAAGFGSRPSVATTAGNARVAQHYGVVGGRVRSRVEHSLRPFLALGAGALRTSVEGEAAPPRQAHSAVQWSFLAEGSVGLEIDVFDRYWLTLAAHAQLTQPYVAIHFADAVVATAGRPNLLLTFTAGAWL